MKHLILSIIFLVVMCSTASSGLLQDYAVQEGLSYENIHEATNNNDGPQVEKFLGYIGLPKGQPYCVAFVVWDYHIAAKTLGKKDVLPRIGRASLMLQTAQKNPIRFQVITPNQIILKIYKVAPGDISIHRRSPPGVKNFNGHAGLILRPLTNTQYEAIEANTQSSEKGDQGEGGGVFKKMRSLKSTGFPVVGIIRIK